MQRIIPNPMARERSRKTGAWAAIVFVLLPATYYAGAAYALRYRLDSVLFPHVLGPQDLPAPVVARVSGPTGNEILLRRYGQPRTACAIFFPGQHGERPEYRKLLFRELADAGVAVFAVDYPGQGGAAGSAVLHEIPALGRRAVLIVIRQCGQRRTVVLGRSLGSMVAVYAAAGAAPAGIVLDSAAPSLSAAITARIRSRWYLRPLAILPLNSLLSHDYSLAEALAYSPTVHVVVFQGTADRRTPIRDLEGIGSLPPNVRMVPVPQATHANAYRVALNDYVNTVLALVR